MKAIIMAGGEGSRLRPLTCDCPKPMLRLMGRPLMEYAIRLLQRHGVTEIGATLGYLPDDITDYFGDGEALGARLHYFIERLPLGTAGSVRRAKDFLDQRFLVLSGDGVTDFDLGEALRFHESRGALATLVLVRSGTPQEYGMVVTDADGRVRSFHEKPGRSDIFSDRVNTGIYILEPEVLERIPEGEPCDFGHDLFPALVREGLPVYGCTLSGYWCDVGDVGAYLRVHADAMDGRIALPGLDAGVEGAILEPGCSVEAPAYIAPGAHICAGARIGAYSCVGEGCFVAPGASVKRSVLFRGCRIEPGAQLRGCVVGTNAVVGEGAQLYEESAVGSCSQVGARAVLAPGIKLWPDKDLAAGERPEENVVWGLRREQRFSGGALLLESPAQTARAAQSCVAELKPGELLIGRASSPVSDAMWHAAASGAMAQGAQVIDAGECTLPQLRHALRALRPGGALLVEENRLTPLLPDGARLPERTQRAILKLFERGDFPGPFAGITRPLRSAAPTDAAYVAELAAKFRAKPESAPPIALFSQERQLLDLAVRACERIGLRTRSAWTSDTGARPGEGEAPVRASRIRIDTLGGVRAGGAPVQTNRTPGDARGFDATLGEGRVPEPGEVAVELLPGGERAILSDAGGALTEVERQLAIIWTALELGEAELILPLHATRAAEALTQRFGARATYLPGEQAVWMSELARRSPLQFELQFDGLGFALSFLSTLVERGLTLSQWRRDMPTAYRSALAVRVPAAESGRLLHELAEAAPEAELGGGLRLPRDEGWAWLAPDEAGAALTIVAESSDMEAAQELCDFYGRELTRLLKRE